MINNYPKLVNILGTTCDAWLVGSAVDTNNPRDYDVFIPITKWNVAVLLLPKQVNLNSFGGFKINIDGKDIDIWTGSFEDLLSDKCFRIAKHLKSGKIIKAVEDL